jgi:hypothetical protein
VLKRLSLFFFIITVVSLWATSPKQQHYLYKNFVAGINSNSVHPAMHFQLNIPKDDKYISSSINFLSPINEAFWTPPFKKGVFMSGITLNSMYCSPFFRKSDYFYISSGIGLEVYFKRVRWERIGYEKWQNKTFTYIGLPLKLSFTKLFMNSMAINFAFKITLYKDEPTMIGFNLGFGGWLKELRIVKKY